MRILFSFFKEQLLPKTVLERGGISAPTSERNKGGRSRSQ